MSTDRDFNGVYARQGLLGEGLSLMRPNWCHGGGGWLSFGAWINVNVCFIRVALGKQGFTVRCCLALGGLGLFCGFTALAMVIEGAVCSTRQTAQLCEERRVHPAQEAWESVSQLEFDQLGSASERCLRSEFNTLTSQQSCPGGLVRDALIYSWEERQCCFLCRVLCFYWNS